MDALKGARDWKRIVHLSATRFSCSQTQNRPQTFASGEQTVAHRSVKCRRLRISLRQIAVQRVVDQLLASEKIDFEIHVRKRLLNCWVLDTR
jgi:hypothetical protein